MNEIDTFVYKSFTTNQKHTKKSHSPIRERCLEFLKTLRQLGYLERLPLNQAILIFQKEMGIFDRASLKGYFGTQATRSIRKIQRLARYSTGTFSYKTIELAQDIPGKKGYLELLGLATFEKIGKTWFMVLREASIIPQLGIHTNDVCESSGSKDENSLSHPEPFSQGEGSEGNQFERVPLDGEAAERTLDDTTSKTQQTHTLQSEREKLSLDSEAQ